MTYLTKASYRRSSITEYGKTSSGIQRALVLPQSRLIILSAERRASPFNQTISRPVFIYILESTRTSRSFNFLLCQRFRTDREWLTAVTHRHTPPLKRSSLHLSRRDGSRSGQRERLIQQHAVTPLLCFSISPCISCVSLSLSLAHLTVSLSLTPAAAAEGKIPFFHSCRP